MERSSGRAFWGFLLGAATGTALGILFAPKTGRQTREDLTNRANVISREVSQKVGEKMEEVKKYVQNLTSDIKKKENVMENRIENL